MPDDPCRPTTIEAVLRQRLARLDQEWTLTFCFLSNPGFLVLAQLLTQAVFGGGILRSAMLQQPPRHGLEDVKQRDGGFRRLAQKRSHILHRAMGVLRFINSHKNTHTSSLAGSAYRNASFMDYRMRGRGDSRGSPGRS